MKSKTNYTIQRSQKLKPQQADGANWMLIMGGAFLSTLSIRLGWKLKQMFDPKRPNKTEDVKITGRKRMEASHFPPNSYYYAHSEDNTYSCHSALDPKEGDPELPLVAVSVNEPIKDGSTTGWMSAAPHSPELLELPRRAFQKSNTSESPCVSECGSTDMLGRREVIQKLRQQLKQRDEMILEMQTQITDMHRALTTQTSHSAHLQAQLDCASGDLLEAEREIQNLRKAVGVNGRINGHVNGHANGYGEERDVQRIEMLKREVDELKEVIEGKEFLLQSYKEQKTELSSKVKELQLRLSSHVPNILPSYTQYSIR